MSLPPLISTPRLTLIRLTDTSEGSKHVDWFHQHWTSPEITAWSLRGPTHSLTESRLWFIEQNTKYGSIAYASFAKTTTSAGTADDPGEHVGYVSLRLQHTGPTLPPPASFDVDASKETGTETENETKTTKSNTTDENEETGKPLNLRAIAYALFKPYWGNGYAAESSKAMIEAYAASIAAEKEKGEERFYIEAGVDNDNESSTRVLEKLGFGKVGWKAEKEPVFLNGAWRAAGYWIWGMYL